MKTVEASELGQPCLAILDRLEPEGVVITRQGKPVATLVPVAVGSGELIGSLADKITVHGDLGSTFRE